MFLMFTLNLIFQCLHCSPNISIAASLSFHVNSVHEGQNVQGQICDYKMAGKGS